MLSLAKAAFARELEDMKRFRLRIAMMLLALVAFSLAIAFGILAFFFWLDGHMERWQAAGLSGAIGLLLGAILVWGAKASTRPKKRSTAPDAIQTASLLGAFDQKTGAKPSVSVVAAAVIAGIILGRNLPK